MVPGNMNFFSGSGLSAPPDAFIGAFNTLLSGKKSRPGSVLEPELLAFIRTSIPSMWALELLLLLRRATPGAMTRDELVQRLRATPMLIDKLLDNLSDAGLVMIDETGAARFECATPDLEKLCADLATAAAERPVALREAIVSSPSDKLRSFADAFRLKGPNKGKDE